MYVKQSVRVLIGCMVLLTTCVYADTTKNIVANPNFDDSSVASGAFEYQYDDGFWAAAWLFADRSSGIANSSSAWGGEAATNTVVFLQKGGSVSQFLSTNGTGDFTISFDLAQRGVFGAGHIDVYFDNKIIAENISPSSTVFQSYEYKVAFKYGNKNLHMLSFQGIDQGTGTDSTIFLDNVSVTVDY